MENLETVQNALNTPDPTKIGVILAFAIQGTFIVFFVISPIMGYFLARATASRANLVLAWCAGVLVILLGNFGVSVLLRRLIPAEQLSDIALTVLCALGSVAAGILLARYITFWLSDPGKPQWVIEYENMQVEELLPFERRKRQEVARRKRSRR